ncbi:GntR family transcriptional regulator [Bacillus suaedae]|uniref:GntR family transcriptional regulator n=1 Tax=Halalkalibacter suaedae TaxID=2822140 RepID=A0A941AR68_9BACI|nr:GntR family transcriptional regulator [Bacillus suaedae]
MTKYNKIKQEIKSKILDGSYVPHQKISSENQLMKEFGVSRHTIRVAVGELVTDGWLYREQGAGTFCADRSIQTISKAGNKNIAIITTYISDYIFPSIIRGAESYLSELGYQVSLYSTNNDLENEKKILEKILEQPIDGLIIEATKSSVSNSNFNYYFNLEKLNIPYIMINAIYEELDPFCLLMDDEKGGFTQTEHLIQQGHSSIAGFFKTDDSQGVQRMKGFIKAHRVNNMPINPSNLITYQSEEKFSKPILELQKLLNGQNEFPTGLVCYNDELALMLLDVLREKKLHVPDDISIVGYDDSFLASVSEVKLTTIKHPKSRMGEDAAKMIVDLIENERKNETLLFNSIVYKPELVIRQSTRTVK